MGEVFVTFHVIADANGELLAWINAAPSDSAGPRLIVRPEDPSHVLHEDIEITTTVGDRVALVEALQRAISHRIAQGRRQHPSA
jgi:hypothetical protein